MSFSALFLWNLTKFMLDSNPESCDNYNTMKATIEINLGNDAFVQNPLELARVLRNLAQDVEDIGGVSLCSFIGIADINGNTVGSLEVTADEEPNESVKRYQKTQEFFNDTETKEVKQWW